VHSEASKVNINTNEESPPIKPLKTNTSTEIKNHPKKYDNI